MSRPYLQHARRHSPRGGSDKILGVPEAVFGQVDGVDGDIEDPGSGDWTVETDFAGTFTITVDPPFDAIPTVVASDNGTTTNPPGYVQVLSATVDTIVVLTYDHSDPPVLSDDVGFNFVALGVPSSQ